MQAKSGQRVIVLGGANIDIRARCGGDPVPRTSNPGVSVTRPGGVGRNIAENLARLGDDVHLVAPLGRDVFGAQITAHAKEAGIDIVPLRRASGRTGSYLAVMDDRGELVVAVSDMAITDSLTVADLTTAESEIARASAVVLDANLPVPVAAQVLRWAAAAGLRVVLEPVSVAKATRIARQLDGDHPVFAVTPNVDELEGLLGRSVPDTPRGVADGASELLDRGVENVWVRRGPEPSVLVGRDQATALIDPPPIPVVDVTGGGDAMTAGFTHALLRGDSPYDAARFGQILGALTVGTPDTVVQNLTESMVDEALGGASLPDLLQRRAAAAPLEAAEDDVDDVDDADEG